ncbi:class I SAM-dependent methyltransferase [Clostridia bacterium]|nr:class I SAM-dependent methyltransferase [Clostridia bacterium]
MSDYYDMSDAEYIASWKAMIPPARPSKEMLALYENSLLRLQYDQTGEWGLLGCTPELRTLAGKYNRPLACLDINSNSFTAMTPLCSPPKEETFVECDWLEADLPEAFDLILGDGSMIMLPQELYPPFLDNVHRMLKPGGHIITRLLSCDGKTFASAREAIDFFRANVKGKEPLVNMLTDFWILCLNRETMAIERADYSQWLNDLYHDGVLTKEEYLELDTPIMNVDLHCTSRERLKALVANKFTIVSIEAPTDFIGGHYNLVCTLQKI